MPTEEENERKFEEMGFARVKILVSNSSLPTDMLNDAIHWVARREEEERQRAQEEKEHDREERQRDRRRQIAVTLCALLVSGISATFAYLSYDIGKNNLRLQRENAKPSITFDRVTLDLNDTDEWIFHLGFHAVNYIESGHILILTVNQNTSDIQILRKVEVTNHMARGGSAEAHSPLQKKLLGSYLVLCVVLKDTENMLQVSEYYYDMPAQTQILGPRPLYSVGSEIANKIRASHPCPTSPTTS